jgi:hypothetical protein
MSRGAGGKPATIADRAWPPASAERDEPSPGAQASGEVRWLRWAAVAALAIYLAGALYLWRRSAVLTPYSDEFDWIFRWRQLQMAHDWPDYLLRPVNLHRMPWTFGLLALDIDGFGGTNLPLVLSGALSLAVMAWALAREAARAAPVPLAPAAGVLAAMLALMAGNVLDASSPITVNYTHGAVFAVLAIVLSEAAGPRVRLWRAAALLCAMASGLGDAAGLAVWPVLALSALRRRDRPWLAVIVATGLPYLALYAAGQGHDTRASTFGALHDPHAAVQLALSCLALPWARLAPHLSWIAGLGVAALASVALATRGGETAPRAERVACALILFSLGVAAMAGLGRSGVETAVEAPVRYAVLMAPLHVGLLMLAAPWMAALWRANRKAAAALVVAALGLMLGQDALMSAKAIQATDALKAVIAEFQAGRRTPQMQVLVHPDLAHAQAMLDGLRRDGLFRGSQLARPSRP